MINKLVLASRAAVLLKQVGVNVGVEAYVKLFADCAVSSPAHFYSLMVPVSSISGKHTVPCFIGVISRFKRFPFCFLERILFC